MQVENILYIIPRNIVAAEIRGSIHKTLTYSRQIDSIESGKLTHDSISNQELICLLFTEKKRKLGFCYYFFFFY